MEKRLDFAACELEKYLGMMGRSDCKAIALVCNVSEVKKYIEIMDSFEAKWDDAYVVDVTLGRGRIAGTNERSVLLGIYDMLTHLGCRFIRPGRDGELIPEVSLADMNCSLQKVASYRHRGICIEGAVSIENVTDMIDWAPKVGFNSYFLQFREGHTFFERWYTHIGNDSLEKKEYNKQDSIEFVRIMTSEIKKRGMLFHAVGHGWTCESIGYPSVGWDVVDNNLIPDDKRQYLAEVNGKREFFGGIPLNTNLCYSRKDVREMLVADIISYLEKHREVDVLHFWLADNFNNFCECEGCSKLSPTDHYVNILNELDDILTELNIDAKIVFLIYYELLWTPKHHKINNPGRFIMMFAPITRTYTKPYLVDGRLPAMEDGVPLVYEMNKIKCPSEISLNLSFLFEWQKIFSADCFDFDYHLMWDIYRDYTNMNLSRTIYQDIVGLRSLHLNGNISCQVQRAFFPNGICMYIMGKTLFDTSIPYEQLVEEYFEASYGEYAWLAKEYLEKIASLNSHSYMRNETEMVDPKISAMFSEAIIAASEYLEKLQSAEVRMHGNQKIMMGILVSSAEIFGKLFDLLKDKSSGEPMEKLKVKLDNFKKMTCSKELQLSSVLDMYYFNMIQSGFIEAIW